jgi:hypothetical protein
MILTGKEIRALARFVGLEIAHAPDGEPEEILEAELVVSEKVVDGRKYKIAYFYDYPEDGRIDLNDF